MKLWKIDRGKAHCILSSPEVVAAIEAKRSSTSAEGKNFILLQEGIVDRQDASQAMNDKVDALYLGEELLMGKHKTLEMAIRQYI